MTLPCTVAEVLSEHVSFEVECIDRMYLNVYQPRLQHPAGAAVFFVGHRGYPFASSAPPLLDLCFGLQGESTTPATSPSAND